MATALLLVLIALLGSWPATSLAATHYVTNLNDSGAGSLRQAVADAADGDTIRFASGLSGTITLASDLSLADTVFFSGGEGITVNRPGNATPAAITGTDYTLGGNLAMDIHAENTGVGKAYGLDSNDKLIVNNLSGSVSATTQKQGAIGLQGTNLIDIGTLSGSVSAKSDSYYTHALNSLAIDIGTLSGTVSSEARGDVYGLRSTNTLNIGILSGSVSAKGRNDDVYGIFAEHEIDISSISGSITAEAGNRNAQGINSEWSKITINTLPGSVFSKATSDSYGIYTNDGLEINTLSGSVSAEVDTYRAYGLWSQDKLDIATLSGTVTATAGWDQAYGVMSGAEDVVVNTLSGTITATAGEDKAYGLVSRSFMNIDTLSGTVSASAGVDTSYALHSFGSAEIGTLSGATTSAAGRNDAYGLKIDSFAEIDTLSGSVSATAGGNNAFAIAASGLRMNALSGSVSARTDGYGAVGIHSAGVLTNSTGGPLEISGTVSTQADGLSMAVSARNSMNLHVTGTISAEDTSGSGKAYAISSGRPWGTIWSAGGNFNDTVTLGSGASITGKIDLAGGTNLLTLEDAGNMVGDISNITTMTKRGSGTWNTTGSISTGDLNVDSGTLNVNISQKAAPTVTATGTVTNNGVINFSLTDCIPAGSFTALTSSGLAGTGSYTTDSIFLTPTINGNDVDLTKKAFADVFSGSSGTSSQLAAALDANYAGASGELLDLITQLERASTQEEAETALDQMTSLLQTQSMDLSIGAARFQSLATQSRMAEMRSYQTMLAEMDNSPDPDDPETWPLVAAIGDLSGLLNRSPDEAPNGVHLRAMGRTGSMDDHDGFSGYDHSTILLSGGYDRVLGDTFLLGFSAGYAATGAEYNDEGESSSTMDSYSLGLYGSWFQDAWYVDAVLAATFNQYDLKRELPTLGATAEASPDGHTLSAKAEGGYRLSFGNWGLTPRASLEYTSFHQEGYIETGAGAANLIMADADTSFLESGLGVTVDHVWRTDFGMIIPELSALWLHELMTQDREITYSMTGMPATAFSQTTAEAAEDVLRLGAGARFMLENGLVLTTRYRGELEEHARSHSLMFEAQWMF